MRVLTYIGQIIGTIVLNYINVILLYYISYPVGFAMGIVWWKTLLLICLALPASIEFYELIRWILFKLYCFTLDNNIIAKIIAYTFNISWLIKIQINIWHCQSFGFWDILLKISYSCALLYMAIVTMFGFMVARKE